MPLGLMGSPSRTENILKNTSMILLYTYTMAYYSAMRKKGNLVICNHMDGPWGYCAKWIKSDKERQTLYNITYM